MSWNAFRSWGPSARGRFDHHSSPPGDNPDRAILYAAGDGVTALVEVFQTTATVHRTRDEPWLVVLSVDRPIRLLDLRGSWSIRAGASMAITGAEEPATTQAWARAIHEDYPTLHGILYPSAMRGQPHEDVPAGVDPNLFRHNAALFERASASLASRPRLHMPLTHPALSVLLSQVATDYGFELL